MKAAVLDRIALLLSFLGVFVAGVLSMAEYLHAKIPCGASGGCDAVALHPTSHLLGIPNAWIGLLGYLLLVGLTSARILGKGDPRKTLIVGYTITALGTVASLALTYIAFAIIRATCLWCLTSTAVMILLLIAHALAMQSVDELIDVRPARNGSIVIALLAFGTIFALGIQGQMLARNSSGVSVSTNKDPQLILPADAHTFGSKDAPITIVEFGDLVCPACREEYPKIRNYVLQSNGTVKYAFRHFPMYELDGHANALPAAMMAEVAAEKGIFWEFVTAVYENTYEQAQDIDNIYAVARTLGLDTAELDKRIKDKNDPAFQRGMRDITDGKKLGVNGTPAFFILAPGVPPRETSMKFLYTDLERPEYEQFWKANGKK